MQGDTRFLFMTAFLIALFSRGKSDEAEAQRILQESFDCASVDSVEELFQSIVDTGTENQIRSIECEDFANSLTGSFPGELPSLPNLELL